MAYRPTYNLHNNIKVYPLHNYSMSGKRVHGLLHITSTNLSIFSQFLARVTLILQFTKNKIYPKKLRINKYC